MRRPLDHPEILVHVTSHAMVRFRERHQEQHRHDSARHAVAALVIDAIEHLRISKRKPTWARVIHKHGDIPGMRFCWQDDDMACFVLRPMKMSEARDPEQAREYRQRWVVLTVLWAEAVDRERVQLMREYHEDIGRRLKNGQYDPGNRRPDGSRRRRRSR